MKPTEVMRAMITAMGSDPELDKALRVSALAYLDAVEARTDKPKQTKAKPKKDDAEEKGYSPNGKAKAKIDDGTIKALYEGGWSLTKIAEDIGCSTQTVTNHLKAMGLKD